MHTLLLCVALSSVAAIRSPAYEKEEVSAAISSVAAISAPAYEIDEVKALPGWDEALPSRHFSGYLQASPTKRLHYYLVQSEGDWNKDPVVLWFNGGPGCSSLDGFLYEHGPFRVQYDGKEASLARFDYAWSKLATMVYIEAPCGVGFSYSTAASKERDYNATDDTAALDNLAAVESLFVKFPKLKSRDLYITGESYAGIYVPTLAEAIVAKGSAYTGATLKGIAVGNGCSGHEIGTCAFGSPQSRYYQTKYLMSSGFASEPLKDELNAQCDWSAYPKGRERPLACLEPEPGDGLLTQSVFRLNYPFCDSQGDLKGKFVPTARIGRVESDLDASLILHFESGSL